MSAFIKLNKQDAFITPYTAYKSWTIDSASLEDYNIEFFQAELVPLSASVETYPSLSYRTYVLPDDGTFDTWNSTIEEYPGGRTLLPGYLDIEFDQVTGEPLRGRIIRLDDNNLDISTQVPDWTYFKYRVGISGPGISVRSGSISNVVQETNTYTFDITGGSPETYSNLYSVTNPRHLEPTPAFSQSVLTYYPIFNPGTASTTGVSSAQYRELVYRSVKHLYYSGVYTGAESSSSFEDYKQTTLSSSLLRTINDDMLVISMPQEIIGSAIKPRTFSLGTGAYVAAYVSGGYVAPLYTTSPTTGSFIIYDDGEGKLLLSGSSSRVGDIVYTHGQVIITDSASIGLIQSSSDYSVHWQSTYEVYTHNYRCKVREQDLNYSQNPSIKSGSNGDIYDFATGSYFQPYVTTVGLYNDSNELIAVGKLGQPVPKSRYNDMTFVITLDI